MFQNVSVSVSVWKRSECHISVQTFGFIHRVVSSITQRAHQNSLKQGSGALTSCHYCTDLELVHSVCYYTNVLTTTPFPPRWPACYTSHSLIAHFFSCATPHHHYMTTILVAVFSHLPNTIMVPSVVSLLPSNPHADTNTNTNTHNTVTVTYTTSHSLSHHKLPTPATPPPLCLRRRRTHRHPALSLSPDSASTPYRFSTAQRQRSSRPREHRSPLV